jgi:hypothetical protein
MEFFVVVELASLDLKFMTEEVASGGILEIVVGKVLLIFQ